MTNISLEPEGALAELAEKLTGAQRRVLGDLADGGCFFAALREPGDFIADGVLLSERVGIVVHRRGGVASERYRVRNATAAPLYLLGLATHGDRESGFRCFNITPLGLRLRAFLTPPQPEGE